MSYKIKIKKIKHVFGINNALIFITSKKIGINTKNNIIKIKHNKNNKLKKTIKFITYDNTLKNKYKKSINFFVKLKNYKGFRHSQNLPVRGQRTHTNAKTAKRKKTTLFFNVLKKK